MTFGRFYMPQRTRRSKRDTLYSKGMVGDEIEDLLEWSPPKGSRGFSKDQKQTLSFIFQHRKRTINKLIRAGARSVAEIYLYLRNFEMLPNQVAYISYDTFADLRPIDDGYAPIIRLAHGLHVIQRQLMQEGFPPAYREDFQRWAYNYKWPKNAPATEEDLHLFLPDLPPLGF